MTARLVSLLLAAALIVGVPTLGPTRAAAAELPDFTELARDKLPAVVNISTRQHLAAPEELPELPDLPEDTPFREFFERFFEGLPQMPRPRDMTALGSGFVIDPAGYIVTNHHVIAEADEISVILQDERELKAEVIGSDPETDLALLKVEVDEPLPALVWGNSDDMEVGAWVVAIGNPFGLGGTVTHGIISARSRDIRSSAFDDFLQTDASINRGNSGGPLFNTDGEVIGVNSAIFSPSGGNIGIGFAIPSAIAMPIIRQLREGGSVSRGWLGVRIQPVTDELAEGLGLPDTEGALISSVEPDAPADKAGFETGDVVVEFAGQPIGTTRDLVRVTAATPPGSPVEVTVIRDGAREKLEVTLGERPANLAARSVPSRPDRIEPVERSILGLRMEALDEEERSQLGLSTEEGVRIVRIEPDSSAAERGLRPGDVITRVGGRKVATPAEVAEAIDQTKTDGRTAVTLLVLRDGETSFVALPLGGEG